MAKNNKLINQYKQLYGSMADVTPALYASVVLALRQEYGWGYERINRVLMASQHIWEEHCSDPTAMCDRCEREVGINVRRG